MTARIPVFVCGEVHRSDDGAAFRAIRLLAPTVRAQTHVIPVGQLDASALVDLPVGLPCIVVDAVAGVPPGNVIAMPLAEVAELGRARATKLAKRKASTSHELALEQTLALAELLRGAPIRGWFVGIGIATVKPGDTVSPAIVLGLPELSAKLAEVINELAQPEFARC